MKLLLSGLLLVGVAISGSRQDCTADFKRSFISMANRLRARHGVAPLTLDTGNLQAWAQDGASRIARDGS